LSWFLELFPFFSPQNIVSSLLSWLFSLVVVCRILLFCHLLPILILLLMLSLICGLITEDQNIPDRFHLRIKYV
jgi:hypothetical protein